MDINLYNRDYTDIGFPSFVESDNNSDWIKGLIENRIISKGRFRDTSYIMNYREGEYANTCKTFNIVSETISNHGGLMVEICAGPAGGFVPALLVKHPNSRIILSDISTGVVGEWKKVFDASPEYKNTSCATFNVCDIPFKDDSIDIISSRNGFVNIERRTGTHAMALKEIYRVLKPGGLFIVDEIFVTNDCSLMLPKEASETLKNRFPIVFTNFYDEFKVAGFTSIEDNIYGEWSNKDDRSSLADLCRKLGVELIFSQYLRHCVK